MPEEINPPPSPPTEKLISNAQNAQKTMSENYEFKENNKEIPELPEIKALQERLNGYINKDKESFPLNEIQWHVVGENPNEALPSLKKIEEKKIKEKINSEEVTKLADECLRDPQRHDLSQIIRALPQFNSSYDPLKFNIVNRPEELNTLIIELYNYGLGKYFGVHDENIPTAIGIALRVLHENNSTWKSLQPITNQESCATTILKNLKNELGVDRKPQLRKIRTIDLDVCVLTALSCADPYTAIKLIQIADQFIPEYADSAKESVLTRMLNSSAFEKTYELYPDSLRNNLDGILASLGEEGSKFSDLKNFPAAEKLKHRSETRLKERLKKSQDLWYTSQKVEDVYLLEQNFSEIQLTNIVEESLKTDKPKEFIEKYLNENSEKITSGLVANKIAAELLRRIQPELSLENQLKAFKKRANNNPDFIPGYYNRNEYHYKLFSDIHKSNSEKKAEIDKISFSATNKNIEEVIFHNNPLELKDLVLLLKNPDNYIYQVHEVIKGVNKKTNLEEFKKITAFAEKLIKGVSYLQAISEVPETLKILQKNFGFGEFVNPDSLVKVAEKLQKEFEGNSESEIPEIGIYEKVLSENNLDEQINEDVKTAKLIAKTIPKNNDLIVDEKKINIKKIITEIRSKADVEYKNKQTEQVDFDDLEEQKIKADLALRNAKIEKKRNENAQVSNSRIIRAFNRNALSETAKKDKIDESKDSVEKTQQLFDEIVAKIEQGENAKKKLEEVSQRIASLQRLNAFMNS